MDFHEELNDIRRRAGLQEQSRPLLYHGTNIWLLARILQDDALYEGVHWGRKGEPHGPRFTRSLEVAKTFIEYAAPDYPLGGVLAVDQTLLEHDYQLVSWSDVDVTGQPWPKEEQEVVVITDAIRPLSKYLVSVIIDPDVIKEGASDEAMEFAMGWPYMEGDLETNRQLVLSMLKHPKLSQR